MFFSMNMFIQPAAKEKKRYMHSYLRIPQVRSSILTCDMKANTIIVFPHRRSQYVTLVDRRKERRPAPRSSRSVNGIEGYIAAV